MTEQPGEAPAGINGLTVIASLLGLWSLAVAQPLLDLIGRNAAFLVAHDATRSDVLIMVAVVTLVAPLLLAAAVLAWRASGLGGSAGLHLTFVAVLAAVVALVVLQLSGSSARVPGLLTLVVAGASGVVFAAAYRTSPRLRVAVALTAFAAPLAAVVFLVASPASAVVFSETVDVEPLALPDDPSDIVMVVFDELPVASLLDRDGGIHAEAFPNFARLAGQGTFLRDVTTIHGQSSDALPAILSSRYPRADALPIAADHPRNLFTLLADHYTLHVEEPLTELCPVGRCGTGSRPTLARYSELFADLSVVGARLMVPPDLAGDLPPLDQGWRDFRTAAAEQGKEPAVAERFHAAREESPATSFERFVRRIDRQPGPSLHYIHTLLPHSPWRYLADGSRYAETKPPLGLEYGKWSPHPWRAAHGYQRHLVQTQLADRLLGDLLDRLEAEQMYDDALIVVTSDHGASFTPGTSLRVISEPTIPEIARVPVLIKAPGQTSPRVIDRPLETVDILPTVLDIIDAPIPDSFVGRSALDDTIPERTERPFFTASGELVVTAENADVRDVVDRKLSWFAGQGPYGFAYRLVPPGQEALLGREITGETGAAEQSAWTFGGEPCDAAGDDPPPSLPPLLCGTVELPAAVEGATYNVAVAVGGAIAAVTQVTFEEVDAAPFQVLLPPALHGGDTAALRLYFVGEDHTLLEVGRRAG